jgi:hypothetical protein
MAAFPLRQPVRNIPGSGQRRGIDMEGRIQFSLVNPADGDIKAALDFLIQGHGFVRETATDGFQGDHLFGQKLPAGWGKSLGIQRLGQGGSVAQQHHRWMAGRVQRFKAIGTL